MWPDYLRVTSQISSPLMRYISINIRRVKTKKNKIDSLEAYKNSYSATTAPTEAIDNEMRGEAKHQPSMFSHVELESGIPKCHPIRYIRCIVDTALEGVLPAIDDM
jgi:hypothetical protein